MRTLLLLVVFTNTVYMTYSMCGTCLASTNLACVDVDKFKVCSEGVPQEPAINCPSGTICTPNSPVCVPKNSSNQPSCASCKTCDDNKIFACTSYNTFALCYGEDNYTEIEYTCPGKLVCNIEQRGICIDPLAGIGSTCSISTLVTTTTTELPVPTESTTINPTSSPKEFCASHGRGRFDVLSDKLCSQYINCYQSGGVWYGNIYLCPSGTFFNPAAQMCGKSVPPRCSTTQEICD